VSALEEALGGGAGERWGAFVNRAREAWDRSRRPLLEEPLWPNWQVLADREPYPAVPRRRLLRRDLRATTLAEVAAWELADPRLTALLESHALACGLDPRTAPAAAAVLPYMEHTFGSWYAVGGMRELARAVYERCLARGVEFVFGADVTAITQKDGRVSGIGLADGETVEADRVVAGVDTRLLSALVGGRDPWQDGDVRPGRRPVPGRLTVCLALRGGRPEGTAHRTVVHSTDRAGELEALFDEGVLGDSPTVTVLRPDDPSSVPDAGHEAVVLSAVVPAGGGAVDWADEAVAGDAADRLVRSAEAAVPGLADRILWRVVRTPLDTAALTGARGGSVPSPALPGAGGRLLHPANSTRLAGLHVVGGWSHPGGGLPHAGMSGALVAGLIVEGEDFRGSQ
ncbi:NAD(P)/FAD-dependent oxidoreductase, partial [Streptomyces sp. GC420]|uniref:phytoene desaturase family protein n=1 Tax=Streptomyces sp. GC420 TaxID=2697568 RepID=UPI001414DAA4